MVFVCLFKVVIINTRSGSEARRLGIPRCVSLPYHMELEHDMKLSRISRPFQLFTKFTHTSVKTGNFYLPQIFFCLSVCSSPSPSNSHGSLCDSTSRGGSASYPSPSPLNKVHLISSFVSFLRLASAPQTVCTPSGCQAGATSKDFTIRAAHLLSNQSLDIRYVPLVSYRILYGTLCMYAAPKLKSSKKPMDNSTCPHSAPKNPAMDATKGPNRGCLSA